LSRTADFAASKGVLERDLVFTDRDFTRIRRLIHRRAGIVLAEHKRQMVYSRLARLVKRHGFDLFADYIDLLEHRGDAEEWQLFINALTTNLTAFFREAHHFEALAKHLASLPPRPIRIWCCAASTGEEPYSIAMVIQEVLGQRVNAKVLATDIDTEALAQAERGIYPKGVVARLDNQRMKRFFLRGRGSREGAVRVRPEVVAMVEFKHLNLIDPVWPVAGPFDAIFCRNVMIYFDRETQERILSRFVPLLRPDGLLFAGHSESFSYLSDAFRLRGQTVYSLSGQP